LLRTTVETLFDYPEISEEVFGPSTVAVTAQNRDKMLQAARWLTGHLTASIHGTAADLDSFADLVTILERKVGRLIFNEFPTGVDVCHAMHHGGPFPATTDAGCTSVGTAAIRRFARPVCYQSAPAHFLPQELRDENPLRIWRLVNGTWRNDAL
jgi:NADP-dependent aldehyde dehydrogenase